MNAQTPVKAGLANRPLKGPEKVATLLLAMGKPLASRLLVHFDPAELKLITRSAAELGSIPVNVLEDLVEDFAGEFSNGIELQGTASQVEKLLMGVLSPEQITDIMSDVLGNSNRSVWERISAVSETVLAHYLAKEHPQTIALILTQLTSGSAAKVISLLDRDLRNLVTRRLLNLKPAQASILRLLEGKLHEELVLNPPRKPGEATSRMADIINKMMPEQMEDILQSLAEVRPKEAEILRSKLFSFADIIKLAPRARSMLFERVPSERVVLALKGTESDFRDIILSALTARAKRLVENELNNGGGSPQRDINTARRMISDLVLEMAERGEIQLNPTSDDE
jgi:flagellar motor switch protein FliG